MGTSLNIEFLHLRIISTESVIVNESYNAKKSHLLFVYISSSLNQIPMNLHIFVKCSMANLFVKSEIDLLSYM